MHGEREETKTLHPTHIRTPGNTFETKMHKGVYLSVAMINYLAALCWNDRTVKEMFHVGEVIVEFHKTGITNSPWLVDRDIRT